MGKTLAASVAMVVVCLASGCIDSSGQEAEERHSPTPTAVATTAPVILDEIVILEQTGNSAALQVLAIRAVQSAVVDGDDAEANAPRVLDAFVAEGSEEVVYVAVEYRGNELNDPLVDIYVVDATTLESTHLDVATVLYPAPPAGFGGRVTLAGTPASEALNTFPYLPSRVYVTPNCRIDGTYLVDVALSTTTLLTERPHPAAGLPHDCTEVFGYRGTILHPNVFDSGFLPDPWVTDPRFPCVMQTTNEMAACTRLDESAVNAALLIDTEVARQTLEGTALYRDALIAGSVGDTQATNALLCDALRVDGSMDRYNVPWCRTLLARDLSDALANSSFVRQTHLAGVDRMWADPASWYQPLCEEAISGSIRGESYGGTLVKETATSSLRLTTEINGAVHGFGANSVEILTPHGTKIPISSEFELWGVRYYDMAVGVYEDHVEIDQQPSIQYGYWWASISEDGDDATGQFVNLWAPHATSELDLTVAGC